MSGAMTDGILISGACGDNGIEITGACTGAGILIGTGTTGTGIEIGNNTTTGLQIGDATTGIRIGTTTTAILVADDSPIVLGTTVSTAATKVTMEFDETTTGIGNIQLGSSTAPMVYNTNPGATPQPAIDVNITHSAGAGDAVWCSGILSKMIISGDGDSGSKLRAFRGECVVSGAVSSVYTGMLQATHSSDDTVSGAMAALNCDFRVTDANFTGSQTLQTAIFTMTSDQARTVTCTSENMNVVLIKNASAITGLSSLLCLSSAGSTDPDNFIRCDGAATHFVRFSAGASAVCIDDTSNVPTAATHKIKCMDPGGTVFYLVGCANF